MKSLFCIATVQVALCLAICNFGWASEADRDSIRQIETEWSGSLIKRDSKWFEKNLTDDWKMVNADGHALSKQEFIDALRKRSIQYSKCDVQQLDIRVRGDTGVVIGRLDTKGNQQGASFGDERRSNVYVRINNERKCFSTHVTVVNQMEGVVR